MTIAQALNRERLIRFRKNEKVQQPPYKNRYRASQTPFSDARRNSDTPLLPLSAFLKSYPSLPIQEPVFSKPKPNATWIGHATYLIQLNDISVITDPVFSKRCSPSQLVGPKRYTPMPVAKEKLPHIDIVLISHDHYDHLDKASVLYLAKHHKPVFLVPLGVKQWFEKLGIDNVVELSWWGEATVLGHDFYCLPVQHFSGRGMRRNGTLWCAWLMEHPGCRLFFAGDTGYSQDFKDINEVFPSIDVALLPIGAYAPEKFMAAVHCSPEQAVQMHIDLNAHKSLAMHWGTFLLTLEPLDEPPKRLAAALEKRNLDKSVFQVLRHGQTLEL